MQARDVERPSHRTAGFAFKNLSAHGYGTPTDYQKDVANIWRSRPKVAWQWKAKGPDITELRWPGGKWRDADCTGPAWLWLLDISKNNFPRDSWFQCRPDIRNQLSRYFCATNASSVSWWSHLYGRNRCPFPTIDSGRKLVVCRQGQSTTDSTPKHLR